MNNQKYRGLKAEVDAHLATCQICAREYECLAEKMRQEEDDDKPGFRH